MATVELTETETTLRRLERMLDARRMYLALCTDYYDGRHRLAFATSKFRETFGALFQEFADNWCQLVVDASTERLRVEGFRFGGSDAAADKDAWRIWQANFLDAESDLAHTEAVTCGESFILVGPGNGVPEITVESPGECIVEFEPGARRVRRSALKKWLDADGFYRANLYLPDEVVKFRSATEAANVSSLPPLTTPSRFLEVYDDPVVALQDVGYRPAMLANGVGSDIVWEEFERVGNPLGVVSMIPLLNSPTLRGPFGRRGHSDIAGVIPKQDAINKLIADMIVSSEFQAYRQRWATGLDVPTDEQGRPIEAFKAAVSRLWTVADPDVKFGEFGASDLSNYVKPIETMVQHIAAQTRTPPHYLLGQSGAFPSGESLKSTETGLVAKVTKKQLWFGEAWEEAMRLAFALVGRDDLSADTSCEALWRDPESRMVAVQADAAVKDSTIGIPLEVIMADRLGYSPQKIERVMGMVERDQIVADALALEAPAPVPPGTPPPDAA